MTCCKESTECRRAEQETFKCGKNEASVWIKGAAVHAYPSNPNPHLTSPHPTLTSLQSQTSPLTGRPLPSHGGRAQSLQCECNSPPTLHRDSAPPAPPPRLLQPPLSVIGRRERREGSGRAEGSGGPWERQWTPGQTTTGQIGSEEMPNGVRDQSESWKYRGLYFLQGERQEREVVYDMVIFTI